MFCKWLAVLAARYSVGARTAISGGGGRESLRSSRVGPVGLPNEPDLPEAVVSGPEPQQGAGPEAEAEIASVVESVVDAVMAAVWRADDL